MRIIFYRTFPRKSRLFACKWEKGAIFKKMAPLKKHRAFYSISSSTI